MTWQSFLGNPQILERFRLAHARGRLAGTFLFVGDAGVGKRTFALKLAQALLCQNSEMAERLDACGTCASCTQVIAGAHPDIDYVSKPADKSSLPIELLIGDREHRMREGLVARLSLKPFYGGRKLAIIDDADYLQQEAANCLLKTLEEPPPNAVLFLLGTNEQRQLPTIRSRARIVRFERLTSEQVAELLVRNGDAPSPEEAKVAASLGAGNLESAKAMLDEAVREFREQFLMEIFKPSLDVPVWAKQVIAFVDDAGKEGVFKRERLRLVVSMAEQAYTAVLRQSAEDDELRGLIRKSSVLSNLDAESVTDLLERCLDARVQIDANANQATLVECFLDDLRRIGFAASLS
jgi:DNA polymerase III subunit delta'